MTSTASEESVARVEGPNGAAEVIEVWADGRLVEYRVSFNGTVETFANIGEAYIAAGEKTGTPT
jgi:hypothetical protein